MASNSEGIDEFLIFTVYPKNVIHKCGQEMKIWHIQNIFHVL